MPEQFKRYLTENARIQAKYTHYYLKRISECYAYFNESLEQKISSEQKQQFLHHMPRSHEDGQVKQPDYALRLYNFFLSRQGKQPPSGSVDMEKERELPVSMPNRNTATQSFRTASQSLNFPLAF